jgi:hypothetical protein
VSAAFGIPVSKWDILLKIINCHECRGAGRDDRNLQSTNHAPTLEQWKGWRPCP